VEQQKLDLERTAKDIVKAEVRIDRADDFVLSAFLQWPWPPVRHYSVPHRENSGHLSYCPTDGCILGGGDTMCMSTIGSCTVTSFLEKVSLPHDRDVGSLRVGAPDNDVQKVTHFEKFAFSIISCSQVIHVRYAPHLTVAWPRGISRSQVRMCVWCAGTPCQPADPGLTIDLLKIERSLLSKIRAWPADFSSVAAAAYNSTSLASQIM
jgi:hypothetical protein